MYIWRHCRNKQSRKKQHHIKIETHFSRHVFSVHCAYMRAAGSEFARNPTRCGGLSSDFNPSLTSPRSPSATLRARTTLHDDGGAAAASVLGAIWERLVACEPEVWFWPLKFQLWVDWKSDGGCKYATESFDGKIFGFFLLILSLSVEGQTDAHRVIDLTEDIYE